MTQATQGAPSGTVSGKMFLYENPELLTPETHGSMGFKPAERPFDFVKSVRAVPLTMIEFGSAQRQFPIIFSNLEKPVPLAIVGLLDDVNLFVDDDGNWDPMCYVPTYLRCHPFAFASESGGRLAVVVDRDAASVSDAPDFPFFVDGKISEHADALMRLCAQYEGERKRTLDFCDKLRELELLAPLRAEFTPDSGGEAQQLANYVGINTDKLDRLSADAVYELHSKGFLSAIYLQLYSLENWRHLMARRVAKQQLTA